MLGKLIKHEFKAVSKILVILHIALIFTTLIGFIAIKLRSKNDNLEILSSITIVMYVLILIAIAIAVLIYTVVRFYRNLFTDEGYLMNTLPVKSHELILSKLFVGFVWCIINSICTCISVFLLLLGQFSITEMANVLSEISNEFLVGTGIKMTSFIPLIIIGSIISIFYMLIMFYAAISLGQTFGKHKILFSLGAYIVLYVISQIISTIGMIPFGLSLIIKANDNSDLKNFGIYFSSILVSLAISIVLSIIYFVISNYILNKKLNLE
ncbi:MAG: hypothetical protein ACERKZ_20190 [Lachnotalea sp.]